MPRVNSLPVVGSTSRNVSMVKIRRIYSRAGRAYCALGIPSELLERLGWVPGEFVMAYLTKDGALKAKRPAIGDMDAAGAPEPGDEDYNTSARAAVMKARPGSVQERAEVVEREAEEALAKLDARLRAAGRRDPDRDLDLEFDPELVVKQQQPKKKPQSRPRSRRSGSRRGSRLSRRRR